MTDNFKREVAHRIFAAEFKESDLQVTEGEGTYAVPYLITPTGAKCNRVFIVGTLTEKEDVGTDSEFWRGRIVDPTGAFFVTAGQYQPEAALFLANVEGPQFVAVVGKPSIYETKEGIWLSSIKAESITVVDEATRDKWIQETAALTEKRLKIIPENVKEHYHTDVKAYQDMIAQAFESTKDI